MLYIIACISALALITITTLIDRKILALSSKRTSPVIMMKGILSSISDAVKLITKDNLSNNLGTGILISVLVFVSELTIMPTSSWNEDYSISYLIGTSWLSSIIALSYSFSKRKGYCMYGKLRVTRLVLSFDIIGLSSWISLFSIDCNILSSVCEEILEVTNMCHDLETPFIYLISSSVHNERQPMDIAESESDLAGGPTADFAGLYFAFLVIMEYRWSLSSLYNININHELESWINFSILIEIRNIISRLDFTIIILGLLVITPLVIYISIILQL